MVSQSLQYGTPFSHALRAVAEELRRDTIIKLEERAHKLAPSCYSDGVVYASGHVPRAGGKSFLHLTRAFQNRNKHIAMTILRPANTIRPSNAWSYDRVTQFFGGLWFFLLALVVAAKIVASPDGPGLRASSFCLGSFYLLLGLLILTRSPAKARSEGLLPKIAAFVGTYLPWTIPFFGKTHQALPNLASTVLLIGVIMMLVTIRHLGRSFRLVPQARSVVQTGPYRSISTLFTRGRNYGHGGRAAIPVTDNGNYTGPAHRSPNMRILYEEDLLRRTLPEYSRYEPSRWRLIPLFGE